MLVGHLLNLLVNFGEEIHLNIGAVIQTHDPSIIQT